MPAGMATGDTTMIAAPHLDEDTDEELIRRFQQSGDTAAFESLVHRY